jgi:hypothetical protein
MRPPKPAPKPLEKQHIAILIQLLHEGPLKAFFFDEETLDDLFRMRPRLIALRPGHQEAVVEITTEGIRRLNQALNARS